MNWEYIQEKLNTTISLMWENIYRVRTRGLSLEETEIKVNELEESSRLFLSNILPWYHRLYLSLWCCPKWWFSKKKKKKEEDDFE